MRRLFPFNHISQYSVDHLDIVILIVIFGVDCQRRNRLFQLDRTDHVNYFRRRHWRRRRRFRASDQRADDA